MIVLRTTENFTANLQEIAGFWDTRECPAGFDALLTELRDPVFPNLRRNPRMGRNFLARQPQSVDSLARMRTMDAMLKSLAIQSDVAEVREYVMTDYLLLYLLVDITIHLLAIKHQKQLAFDFVH